MKKHSLYKQIHTIVLSLIFITSCKGQNQTSLQKDMAGEQKAILAESSKIETKEKVTPNGPSDIVQCAMKDKAGNLWFGTSGGEGVFRYDGKTFTNFTEKDGLCNNNVYSILEDKNGNIWFGTADGVCRYDPTATLSNGRKTFTIISIPVANGGVQLFNENIFINSPNLSSSKKNQVESIFQDKAGNLWFGTLESGVYRYDGKTFTNFLNNDGRNYNDSRHYQDIKCIVEDKTGNLWFGSWNRGGVWRFDGKSFTNFLPKDGLSDDMIFCTKVDKNGNIWFGTRDNGVIRYDGKSFTNFSEKDGLCNNNITSILEDKAGNIWFGSAVKSGTKSGGVCLYTPSATLNTGEKSFKKIRTKEGLMNNDFFCSIEDNAGNIWFGGRYGRLFQYDGKSFTDFSEKVHKHI